MLKVCIIRYAPIAGHEKEGAITRLMSIVLYILKSFRFNRKVKVQSN